MSDSLEPYMIRLISIRKKDGIKQNELAAYLGTSSVMCSKYEHGLCPLPLKHLVPLCKLFHVSTDYILGLPAYPGRNFDDETTDCRLRFMQLREKAGYRQIEVANYLGTSKASYSRYESCLTALPLKYLIALCKLYQVSSDAILGMPAPDPPRKRLRGLKKRPPRNR